MIIAFDGYSGTGKSTLSRLVAKTLGFKCLNTGMIYRALTYFFVHCNILPDNGIEISKRLKTIKINIFFVNENQHISINSDDVTSFVSDVDVQQYVSLYSQNLEIRNFVTNCQRDFASKNNVVVEGRDIGTCVFPNADYKFFISCDIKVRANRRLTDLKKIGQNSSLNDVINSLEKRDYLDTTRELSPLKRADDAIDIDTTNSSIDDSLNEILNYIKM